MLIWCTAVCLADACGLLAQGTLPAAWGTGAQFPALRLLSLTKNWRIVGTLPAAWGGNSSSLQKLEACCPPCMLSYIAKAHSACACDQEQ
jgi:hypothetical protein